MVAVALAGLKPKLREVVELKTYAGLTLAEIAVVTGKAPRHRGHTISNRDEPNARVARSEEA